MALKEIKYESFGIYEINTSGKDIISWLESVWEENDWYEFTIEVKALIAQKDEKT